MSANNDETDIEEAGSKKGTGEKARGKAGSKDAGEKAEGKDSGEAGSKGSGETSGEETTRENERRPKAAETAEGSRVDGHPMEAKLAVLSHNALRNALYHTGRRRALEFWNRVFNLVVILLGAAAVADAAKHLGIENAQIWIGLMVAGVAALQLVLDFGGHARTHQELQREYYNVLAEIQECTDADDVKCAGWQGKMTRIAANEPPILRALDAKAYNDALDALEYFPRGELLRIPFWHKLFGWFWSFDGYTYEKRTDYDARPGWFTRLKRWWRKEPASPTK